MSGRLEVAVCPAFLGEVRAALASLATTDVDVVTVPTTCRVTLKTPDDHPVRPPHTRLWLACSAPTGANVPPGWTAAAPEQCFHLVAPSPLVASLQRDGAYVVTPGWVRSWRARLTEWGFDQAGAREFFAESMKEIALLDTGVDPDARERSAAFAEYVGLPLRVLPVGVEFLQQRLSVLIHEWRAREAQLQADRDRLRAQHRESELAMALDLLRALAGATTVAHAVDGLAELTRTLFAPREVFVQVFTGGVATTYPASCPEAVRAQLAAAGADPTAVGDDTFVFRLTSRGEPVAVLWVGGVAFPARRDDYLRLAAALAEPCATTLLVAQAAERQRALELELTEALAQARTANEQLVKAHADVTRMHEQTRALERLKSQLFATVSHELRTPLTLILAALAQQRAAELPESTRAALELMGRNARLLQRHVSDILDVSRVESGRMTLRYSELDLGALVRRVASLFTGLAAERSLRLAIDAPEGLTLQADAEKLERVLINLLSNAFKFSPEGAELIVRAQALDAQHARLTVEDRGPGIPAEHREDVFEPFRQLDGGQDRRVGGTGLGLAIVRDFTRLHGGEARVEAAEPTGARFTVTLPRKAPPGVEVHQDRAATGSELAQQAAEELSTPRPGPEEPDEATAPELPLALVVEDIPDMRTFLSRALRAQYRIVTAADGAQGLEQANRLRPDVIISDVMMPVMSGDVMVERLRANHAFDDVPIVLLTAKDDAAFRLRMLRGGVQDYLAKPFTADELRARLDNLMRTQREARARLRRTEARLAAHVNHSPLAAIEFDREGRITLWAGRAEALFGRPVERVLGRTAAELGWLDEDDSPPVQAQREALRTGRVASAVYTSRAHRPDGAERVCEWHCSALRDADGQVASLLARVVDITDRVDAQAELQRLYQAARAEAEIQSTLVTEVNHRVKNNLVSLLGLLLMEKRLGGNEAIPPAAFEHFSARVRALLAAHELLTASRWAPVPVVDLVNRSVRSALETAGLGNRTQLELHAEPTLKVTPARAGTLALILSELATNAAKYAVGDDRRLRLSVEVKVEGPLVHFTLRDDGPGFPAEVLRGDRRGVGLRLTQELAAGALSGTLALANDAGACVTLTIEGEKTVTP